MEIEVGRMLIRDMQESDLKEVKHIRDASLDYLDTQVSYSYEETCNWFRTKKPQWYGIEIRDKLAGYIRTSNHDSVNKTIYVGLDLHPNFRGHGYAFQAYQAFLDWLKINGYLTAHLKVQISNHKAYNLYRKLGFTPVGVIPNAIILPSGKTIDSVLMYKSL